LLNDLGQIRPHGLDANLYYDTLGPAEHTRTKGRVYEACFILLVQLRTGSPDVPNLSAALKHGVPDDCAAAIQVVEAALSPSMEKHQAPLGLEPAPGFDWDYWEPRARSELAPMLFTLRSGWRH